MNVFNHVPAQLAKDNKKSQISKVASDARFRDYRGCMEWLDDAGLVNICYCLNFPELLLQGNYDETKYKIYFADSGMLVWPCWMKKPRKICGPTKTSESIRVRYTKMLLEKHWSKRDINSIAEQLFFCRQSILSRSYFLLSVIWFVCQKQATICRMETAVQ